MNEREAVINTLYECMRVSLVERDINKMVSFMTEDLLAVGLGEQGLLNSREQAYSVVKSGIKLYDTASYEVLFDKSDVVFHSENVASICVVVKLFKFQDGVKTESGLFQTASLRKEKGEWKICLLHGSPIALTQESIEAYPLAVFDASLNEIRLEMQKTVLGLMSDNFSCGIFSTFLETETGYSLYYINDTMLHYLGFERKEFCEKFKHHAERLIHPDDVEMVSEVIAKLREKAEDYEIKIRMQKKDGSYLWMLERARFTTDAKGNEIILGVFIDINNMVHMQECLQEQAVKLEEQSEEVKVQNEQLLLQRRILEEQATELTAQKEVLSEQAKELTVSEERFRIALGKSTNIIFDYDITSGNIVHSSSLSKKGDFVTHIDGAAETLISFGCVAASDLPVFWATFDAIRYGQTYAECTVRVDRTENSGKIWCKISLTGISDDSGKPVRVVGLVEDITNQKEAEFAYAREEQYRQAVLSDAVAAYIINYTKNVYENSVSRYPLVELPVVGALFDERILQKIPHRLSPKAGKEYLQTFLCAAIVKAFHEGSRELRLDYEFFVDEETPRWMTTIVRLVQDITSGDIKGFMYVYDVDEKKRREIELRRKAESDPMTGIYNKSTAIALIRAKLASFSAEQTGVFMILDIDHFKVVNDTCGHPFGDTVLLETAKLLCLNFREDDIIARLGGDEFCVFFCGMSSKERVEKSAKAICDGMKTTFNAKTGKPAVTCSVGIAVTRGVSKSFETLYEEADKALYIVKNRGRDGYAFA